MLLERDVLGACFLWLVSAKKNYTFLKIKVVCLV